MKNLIPKSLAKQKGTIYKNVTILDVIVFISYLAISSAIFFPLTFLDWMIRIFCALGLVLILSISFVRVISQDVRLYKVFWYMFKYIVSPKIYERGETTLINPYQRIENGLIKTKPNDQGKSYYIKIIKIQGFDITSLDKNDAKIKIDYFHNWLVNQKKSMSILKLNEINLYNKQIKKMEEKKILYKEQYDDSKITEKEFKNILKQLDNEIELFKNHNKILNTSELAKNFYIVFYDLKEELINDQIENTILNFNSIGIKAEKLNEYESINIIKNIFNPMEKNISKELIKENKHDLDKIFNFEKVEFKKDHIAINNELLLSINSVSEFPIEVNNYWLSNLFLSTDSNVFLNINPLDSYLSSQLINKAIVNYSTNQYQEKSQIKKMELEEIKNGFVQIANDLVRKDQSISSCTIMFLNYDIDLNLLKKSFIKNKNLFSFKQIKLNKLNYRQLEALSSILPKKNNPLQKQIAREFPSRTLANGYPFLTNSLMDEEGFILAKDWMRDPFIFDQFKNDKNRKNNNMLILGSSGTGKTMFAKRLIDINRIKDKQIFIIDIEGEYKKETKKYDGKIFEIGKESENNINPLHIHAKKDESIKIAISSHILMLEKFFQVLFPEISFNQLQYITTSLKEFYSFHKYEKNHMTSNHNFDDLYNFLLKNNKKINKNYPKEDIQYINELIRSELCNEGKLSFLYNNKNPNLKFSNISTFDLSSLFEKSNQRIIQSQLFLILNYLQKEIGNKEKESIIFIDEAHILIDKNNLIALDFILQMSKKIRKINGSLILITQSPSDFISTDEIKQKTKEILNNMQYSLIFNLSSQSINDVSDMYSSYGNGLSEDERNYLARAYQGQALFFVTGFSRYKIEIKNT